MKYQWSKFLPLILTSFLIFFSNSLTFGQANCIQAPASVCLGDCIPITYVGTNSDMASYSWSISCGTISNPNLKNPHEACFNSLGVCTISLITQEPGSPPDSCEIQITVNPLPTAKFVLRTDSLCLGNCLGLRIDFIGSPPFIFKVRDTTGVTTYRSGFNSTTISVCPTASQTYAIIYVEDANCKNQSIQSIVKLKVFPPFNALIYQEYSKLCSSPPVLIYRWFECNTTNLVATSSCFAPPKEDCYCAVLFNGFCYDTTCATFKCNLTCGIDLSKPSFVGDKIKVKYKGNGGPNVMKSWTYLDENNNSINSTSDSLELKYNKPGAYLIKLKVQEEICSSECTDTIYVLSRPCECSSYNKNEIKKISSNNSSCCYQINGDIASMDCFTHMKVLTNAGSFVNVSVAGGWSISNSTNQTFILTHQSNKLPLGSFSAGNFCISNADNYTITVYYYFDKSGKKDSCKYQYIFNCSKNAAKCDSLNSFLELQQTLPGSCCYLLRADNSTPNYFNKIVVSINSGTFANLSPTLGYSLNTINNQSFSVSHNSGYIPTGSINPVSFCLNGIINPVTIQVYYIRVSSNGNDTCQFKFRFYCPDDGTAKENCCDSTKANLISYGNLACCWNLFSVSSKASCFSKICVTTTGGSMNGIVPNSGWTSSTIPNGVCFIPNNNIIPSGNVNPGRFCLSGFVNPIGFTVNYYDLSGNVIPDCKQTLFRDCKLPPVCSCDSLDNQIFQNTTNPGICCHSILGTIPNSICYTKIEVSVNSGNFSNIIPAVGYSISGSGNSFIITHNSGHLPAGNIMPANFCVNGSSFYTITVQYHYTDQNGFDQRCIFSSNFDCPKLPAVCSCDSLFTQINQISSSSGSCCNNFVSYVPKSKCYTKITVSTSAGTISNIVVINGFSYVSQGSSNFTITHNSGYIPAGTITPANFCVNGATLYTITVQYIFIDQNGIEQKCIESELFDCPKAGSLCNCDSISTQINQTNINPGLCCYNFTSKVNSSKCFTKIAVSINSGSFTNITTATGFSYINQSNSSFTITHGSGYIPNGNITPANFCIIGATTYTITIQYFYLDQNGLEQKCIKSASFDCPPPSSSCNCDSLTTNIIQSTNNPGFCCHSIHSFVPKANCMIAMSVSLNLGSFVNVNPDTNYTIGNLNSNSFNIAHVSGYLPIGNIQPVTFCVVGATSYILTVKYIYFNNGKLDTCKTSKSFDCKPSDSSSVCDHGICLGNRAWQGISAFNGIVYDLKNYNCKLYAAGQFTQFANLQVNNIAEWNGSSWSALSGGGVNGIIKCMTVHNGLLYVGGQFTMAGNVPVNNIAAWNGSSWSSVGGGLTGINPAPAVFALLSTTNGLVVGGQFALTGSNNIVNNIALWNGTWSNTFGTGIPYPINTLNVYNGNLYAAGAFFGNPYNSIAKWNGTSWSSLTNNGVTLINNVLFHGIESSFILNNELLIGGHFANADNLPNTQHIVRWNGTNFVAMLEGDLVNATNSINEFINYDGHLFVGGEFDQVGFTLANGVAESFNSQWANVSHPNKVCWALETYDSCGAIACDLYSAGEGFVNRWTCVSSTENNKRDINWKLYPNPASQILYVDLQQSSIRNFNLTIKNLQGKNIETHNYDNTEVLSLDISNIPTGVYLLELFSKEKGRMQKWFIKAN
ncbi:MAG: T9SS type A sorting domain-containing protein [Saprospiraceae bacterium]